ncbi:o-succinylbenzoate--CoA ligase [Peribacillus deserti]|uniref:2-succinylbenzoate--CoA ligase n=1 Tax=Peribacillus deserti TaxID=673318 RepID=A0A2N5M4P3_9BACI|nr:o-succinylbenzoate--CoA ligase [Peribacillus deserti]PLT29302.1 o-succinylbenzoate--CoA ligase [Peribacillus deserti]
MMGHSECLPNWLEKRSELSPERIALEFKDQRYSFLDMHNHARNWASAFYSEGIRRGDTVGLLAASHADTVFILHALFYLGVKVVLLNSRLTQNELRFQLDDSEASFLISEQIYKDQVNFLSNHGITAFIKEDFLDKNCGEAPILHEFVLEETATIMYTSGTTGKPKGVLQTFGNHWWSAVGSVLNLGLHEKDTWLCTVPVFHISGLSILMRSVIYGIRVILHDSFNEKLVNDDIRNKGVTIISVVTAMLNRMISNLGDQKYPRTFRCMLLGGGPAPRSLLEDCKLKHIPVFQTYGMTETSSQIVTLSPEYSMEKLGSAGKPLLPSELYIELDGKKAPAYQAGEIVVKGPNVTKGYFNRAEETHKALRDGWFYTGDIGYLDDEGFLFVMDRRSDLIISGGENIYPAEIEGVLSRHPHVFEAGAAGFSDSKWGQVPYAFVVLTQENAVSEEELKEFCKQYLASYKTPKRIIFVKELPRNGSNKLLRRELHTLLEEEQ